MSFIAPLVLWLARKIRRANDMAEVSPGGSSTDSESWTDTSTDISTKSLANESIGFFEDLSTDVLSSLALDMGLGLCPPCTELDLTVDKFIISSPTTSQYHNYFKSSGLDRDNAPGFTLKTGKGSQYFAKLHQLRARRSRCRFCAFLANAVERHSHKNAPGNTECFLTWQVDGRGEAMQGSATDRERPTRRVNKTRRLRLSWINKEQKGQVHLILMTPNKDTSTTDLGPRAPSVETICSLGRELHDQAEKQALIRNWLDYCTSKHQGTCEETYGTDEKHLELVKERFFCVIDVVDMQLKALPIGNNGWPARYVALSYVWGAGQEERQYMTTKSTVMSHIKHGGLSHAWTKLPRTIQDAILLVNRLGERYVWIDSLCIVQDSFNCWSKNAEAMHLIYGHAHFTICAADGDAESGLRAAAPLLRGWQSTSKRSSRYDVGENDTSGIPSAIEYAPGTRILVTRPLDVVIYDSMWSKRAWTFQEQILSRRCLIFAEGRIYFQCRFAGISEDIRTDSSGNGWSLNRTDSPLQSLDEMKRRPIWFYMRYVKLYTSRNLTNPQDILSAFEGIAWLLERHMKDKKFLFGLPTSHFDIALLWVPTKPLIRRRKGRAKHSAHNTDCTVQSTGKCNCQPDDNSLDTVEFPSWSWCGWMGEGGTGGQVVYHEDMLEGCLLNIRQWLEHHTSIKWHVRDEKGYVRPLRDKVRQTRGREIYDEDRWNGYDASEDWRPALEDAIEITGPPSNSSRQPVTNPSRRRTTRYPSPIGGGRSPTRSSRSQPRPRSTNTKSTRFLDETSGNPRNSSPESRKITYHVGIGAYVRRGSTMMPNSRIRSEETNPLSRPGPRPKPEDFDHIIPDNPFCSKKKGPISSFENPRQDLPQNLKCIPILQFNTLIMELYVTIRGSSANIEGTSPQRQLLRCDIADDGGDWCGSIEVPDEWMSGVKSRRSHFIAISDAKAFTKEECPSWTYYIPNEMEESRWDLYYVLLLERDTERCLWERVALGKVFKAAFENARWSEIKLG